MSKTAEIALIGAGPLGLEMAVALRRAGLSYVHLEAGQIGATMQWWAPGTRWFSSNERISIAGVPLVTPMQEKATREQYLAYLRGVAEQFALAIDIYTRVTGITGTADGFALTARKNLDGVLIGPEKSYHVRKIILATGGTAHPNLLGVPGEDLPHVSHYFADPHKYFQRAVLVVGGRNSAVEAALRCHRAGARVSISYHGAAIDATDIKYWLYPEFSSLIKSGAIEAHFQTRVARVTPSHVTLTCFSGQGGAEAEEREMAADFVLLLTGYSADMSLATMAGVELTGEQHTPVHNPHTMESNVAGVYVAGTAIAGTQRRYRVFLENCHLHVEKIVAHLTGRQISEQESVYERPES